MGKHRQLRIFEDEVQPSLEAYRADYLRRARERALYLGRHGAELTVNDIRSVCPPPRGVDPRVMGAIFSTKDFVKVGYRRSGRRECHNRPISVFVVAPERR